MIQVRYTVLQQLSFSAYTDFAHTMNKSKHIIVEMSQLRRLGFLSHRRPEKAQMSLHILPVLPEPSLFAQSMEVDKRV